VHFAELAIRDAANELMALAVSDSGEDPAVRAEVCARVAGATALARDAVRLAIDSLGTSVHETRHPIQRALRDITVGAGH